MMTRAQRALDRRTEVHYDNGMPAQAFIRLARKEHACIGVRWAERTEHPVLCDGKIPKGQQYIECVEESPMYQSGARYCFACAAQQGFRWPRDAPHAGRALAMQRRKETTMTTQTATHTPGPWYLDGDGIVAKHQERAYKRIATVKEPRSEDAAFIVRAVNAHDELVAALEGLLEYHRRDDYVGLAKQYQEAAEAALAKVNG